MNDRGGLSLLNRFGNPVLRGFLRSPLHALWSRRLSLITVTGRRSGRTFTIPTAYEREGDSVRIAVGWPERKLWWRNLRGAGAPVEMLIGDERRSGHAVARGDEASGVVVEVELGALARDGLSGQR
jgi:hypothetical protein